jgi:hypothetical protein
VHLDFWDLTLLGIQESSKGSISARSKAPDGEPGMETIPQIVPADIAKPLSKILLQEHEGWKNA